MKARKIKKDNRELKEARIEDKKKKELQQIEDEEKDK
jgi:hypothetical protein